MLMSWTLCGPRDAAILPNALRGVAPVVARALVIWTGPGDARTRAEAWVNAQVEGLRVDLDTWAWCDDFAAARNAALACAAQATPGAWGLMLDADESVICPDPPALRSWLSALPSAVDVVVCYAADGTHGRERIFRLPCPHKWVGRTHESIPVGPGQQAQAPADLIAWTERPKTAEQLAAIFARDEGLLAAEIAEHPNDPRWHAYRGSALAGLGRHEDAVAEYHRAAELSTGEDSLTACLRAADLLCNALHRPAEAIEAAAHGMVLNASWGEFPWIAGMASMHIGRPDQAIAWARIAAVHGVRGEGRGALAGRVGFRSQHALTEGPERLMRAARAAMAPRDKVRCLVFSKDRPMQLDACLRSLRLQCADLEALPVHVIVKATSQEMADAYAELDAATPWATLHPERDFRNEVMIHLDRCDHILLVVDDTVFVRRFTAREMVEALEAHRDAIGFSLRLGGNCSWCYPVGREQTRPPCEIDYAFGFSFAWPGAGGDWGYPLEVSSSLYWSAYLRGWLRDRPFSNPNDLEATLAEAARADVSAQCFHMPERLLCPPLSLAFSIPCNKVQATYDNRAGADAALTPASLLARWQEGDRIDVAALAGYTPNACHEEVAYVFERRPRVEHVERPIHITVTSTGFRAAQWAPKCIGSVARQTEAARHVYVGADEDTRMAARGAQSDVWHADRERIDIIDGTGRSVFENLLPIWRSLPDDEVIAWLDGDDWLAHDGALAIVAEHHRRGALVTYGSFMWGDGTPGFAAQADADPRTGAWVTTHLKTFRAGLVKRIREDDFRGPDGGWATLVTDQRVMIPCLEMAGAERSVFVPQILYHYNSGASWEANATPAERAREHAEVRRIREFKRYGRMTWGL